MGTRHRALLPTLLVTGVVSGLRAATLVVDPSGAGRFTEIQAAIDAASDGDEVPGRPGSTRPRTSAAPPETDVDRTPRPQGAAWDLGAFEHVGAWAFSFVRGDVSDDGLVMASDSLTILGWLFLGGAAPGRRIAADTNRDGRVDVSDAVYILAYRYLGGPRWVGPYPDCGPAPEREARALGCDTPQARCR